MKVSMQWLREWIAAPLAVDEVAEKLTLAGCEVEARAKVATAFSGVVVGHVLEREKHPDADRLSVCKVDTGKGEVLQIVCGAQNVRAGMKAPLALIGAVLPMPDGSELKIKKGKLRGVESFGMLCSAVELGMADKSDGLLELPDDAPVGEDLRTWLQLDDEVLELNITPNRGDCLGMVGVAREVALLLDMPWQPQAIPVAPPRIPDILSVTIEAPAACPRYVGRIIRHVNPTAPTPLWMQERLRRAGIRSIAALVDVTNYVLLELGQPMHVFDLAKLQGGVVVRHAHAGESLPLLDGQTVTLRDDTLVIADQQGPVALAGIMGGGPTAVSMATHDVFLEAAHFHPASIMGKARSYGLHTDSSQRFERGVDPEMPRQAMERATELILAICGGEAGSVHEVLADKSVLERPSILLRPGRIQRVLGVAWDEAVVEGVLARLQCDFQRVADGWRVQPPLARFDLAIEEDLLEELARVRGYAAIPARMVPRVSAITVPRETSVTSDRLRQVMVARGYQEAVTFSFVDPKMERLLAPAVEPLALANPLSAELAVMRTTLWSGLLQAVAYNLNRQQTRVRLFEIGRVFTRAADGKVQEQAKLAGVVTGNVYPEQWGHPSRAMDFYDIKGDVEALLGQVAGTRFYFAPVAHPTLHPGQSAQIMTQNAVAGWVGMLHPTLEGRLGLDQPVFLFELDWAALAKRAVPQYQAISKFPTIRRDLAFLVREDVLAAALENAVQKAAIPQLLSYSFFDVYIGKGVPQGQKSVALSLILQDNSRTLEDAEVNAMVSKVIASLEGEVGAVLR